MPSTVWCAKREDDFSFFPDQVGCVSSLDGAGVSVIAKKNELISSIDSYQ